MTSTVERPEAKPATQLDLATMQRIGPKETLPVLIDQATRSLAEARTYGELLEVKEQAEVVYDAAKSAARMAKAKENHDSTVAFVAEAQGKAVAIIFRADIRLAQEYDAAKERGEVATRQVNPGSVGHVGDGDMPPPTTADLGIDRRDVSNGRKLAEAEEVEPGAIERAVSEVIAEGAEPTKAAVKAKLKPKPAKPEPEPVADAALWVWGRVKDFERNETLRLDPAAVFAKMTEPMKDDVGRLLPRVLMFLQGLLNEGGIPTSSELERLLYHMPAIANDPANEWAGFAKSILGQCKKPGWQPSPKQAAVMRRLATDLFTYQPDEEDAPVLLDL